METQKYQISWESLQTTQHIQLSPSEVPWGSAMTIPSEIQGSGQRTGVTGVTEVIGVTAMARAGRGCMDNASEPGSCRTSLGEIYSFSQIFPMAHIPSITLPLSLGAGQGFQENITKAQRCPKSTFLCLPHVGFQWVPVTLSPRSALGISSCLIPLPWGSRLSGIEGNGSPQAGSAQPGFQTFVPLLALCPGPCCHQGHSGGRGLSGSSKRAWI